MRRTSDVLRATAASAALALLVAGLPLLLISQVGWPLPRQLPRLSDIADTMAGHQPLETTTVWKILAVILWLAWLQVLVAVVIEAVATARGALPRSVPGFNLAHGLVAPLVTAIVLVWPAGPTARAAAEPAPIAVSDPPPTMPMTTAPTTPPPATAPTPRTTEHTVQRRDTLWDLAEHYLGDGYRAGELFELNRGRPQPDGGALTDPGVIRPGWVLLIPAAPENSTQPTPTSVTVAPGDNLWDIATDQLHDGHRYVEIVELNQGRPQPDGHTLTDPNLIEPGWVLDLPRDTAAPPAVEPEPISSEPIPPAPPGPEPPVAPTTTAAVVTPPTTPAPEVPSTRQGQADDEEHDATRTLAPLGLVGGGVATAGLLVALERRRRAQLRRRERGQRLPEHDDATLHTEIALRAGADPDGSARIDDVTRAAAAANGSSGLPRLHHLELTDDNVRLILDTPASPPVGFLATGPTRWEPADRDVVLDTDAAAAPTPALVPVGICPNGNEVLVDLEAPAVTTISGDAASTERLIRAMAVAAATAPWADHARVFVVGDSPLPPVDTLEEVATLDDALDELDNRAEVVERTLSSTRCNTVAQARAAGVTPDAWAPLIVFTTTEPHELQLNRIRALAARPPLAVALVVRSTGGVEPIGRVIEVDPDGRATIDGDLTVAAHLLAADETRRVAELLDSTGDACIERSPHGDHPLADVDGSEHPPTLANLLTDVDVMVRVLGEVEATRLDADTEERLTPPKQKALEAITYLALREGRVDREDLQAALWPAGANSTKTFHNTIWAARKMLARDRDGSDLFPEPTEGHYLLGDRVTTDYALFHELTALAEEIDDPAAAAALLADALTLVRGEPFLGVGRGYAWVAPHAGLIVAQVVDAAEELAEMRLATGDWRGTEWAVRQGLRVFPCEERLYRLLMRAAHAAGSVPGVHRAFHELAAAVADPDDGVEPEDTIHPETVALLEELTGQRPRADRASA